MKRKRILIADDATSVQQVVNFTLRRAGYQTFVASSLKEVMHILQDTPVHLILLDILFEDEKLNGLDFLGILHENPALSKIPVIILTVLEDDNTRIKARLLGAKEFITKPFSVTHLIHTVQRHIA